MNDKELNEIVKQIETSIRTSLDPSGEWNNKRFGSIQASFVRATILVHDIGMVCRKCLKPEIPGSRSRGKYCCPGHRKYYQQIVDAFYFKPTPWNRPNGEDSIDHINPIANGGLEFDRDNLQWMDLIENIRKSGGRRYSRRQGIKKLSAFASQRGDG